MKRATLASLAAFGVLVMAGCSEGYYKVEDSDPPLVLVRDAGDNVDGRNIRVACGEVGLLGYAPTKVQWAGEKRNALVTCEKVGD